MKRLSGFLSTSLLLSGLLAGSAVLTGCDTVAEIFGLNEIDVNLGSIGQVQLEPEAVMVSSGSVNIGQSIPGNVSVGEIRILAQNVSYTPPGGRAEAEACPLSFWLLVNEVSALSGSLTVDEETGGVSSLSYVYAQAYERAALCGAWPFEACPLAPGDRTGQQIRDTVNQALRAGQLSVSLIVENPGACAGMLAIQQLRFDLSF